MSRESASSATAQPDRRLMWATVLLMLVLGTLSGLYLVRLELGARRFEAFSKDELYFSACAARGIAARQIPSSGCYDSKAPVIFLVHQIVNLGRKPYDLFLIKTSAIGVAALVVLLVGWVSFRVSGAMAAVAASALLLQVFSTSVDLMALKTETVGAVPMLIALALCLSRRAVPSRFRWLGAGLLMGLAIVTKQTYAFAAIGLAFSCWLFSSGPTIGARITQFVVSGLLFGAGLVVPFLAFLLIFAAQGRQAAYLESMFLYPAVYRAVGSVPWVRVMVWRVGDVFALLGQTPLVAGLCVSAIAGYFAGARREHSEMETRTTAGRVLLPVIAAMVLLAFVSPIFLRYHLLPAWILMAILGGMIVGEFGTRLGSAPMVCGFLVTFSVLAAASSWQSNGGRGRDEKLESAEASLTENRGDYAYVLGTWPQFYVYNGLIPASDVLFPWALLGTPANWAYRPPDLSSPLGALLLQAQTLNVRRLFDDFRLTPPRFIVVSHDMARAEGSQRIADVPGFDEYVREHCVFAGLLVANLGSEQSLYRCAVPGPRSSSR